MQLTPLQYLFLYKNAQQYTAGEKKLLYIITTRKFTKPENDTKMVGTHGYLCACSAKLIVCILSLDTAAGDNNILLLRSEKYIPNKAK